MALMTATPELERQMPAVAADKRRNAAPWVGVSTTADRDRYLAEDSVAWRRVCGVLIAIVAAGALSMAILVAAILLTS